MKAIDRINVPTFAVCGTLLGLVRDGSPIGWDHDVDLAIWETDRHRLDTSHLHLTRVLGCKKYGYELTIMVDGIFVDVFVVHQNHVSWFNVGGTHRYEYPLITELTELHGVLVPSNYEACLEANYGSDWREPKRSWNWQTDPPCSKRALPSEV